MDLSSSTELLLARTREARDEADRLLVARAITETAALLGLQQPDQVPAERIAPGHVSVVLLQRRDLRLTAELVSEDHPYAPGWTVLLEEKSQAGPQQPEEQAWTLTGLAAARQLSAAIVARVMDKEAETRVATLSGDDPWGFDREPSASELLRRAIAKIATEWDDAPEDARSARLEFESRKRRHLYLVGSRRDD